MNNKSISKVENLIVDNFKLEYTEVSDVPKKLNKLRSNFYNMENCLTLIIEKLN